MTTDVPPHGPSGTSTDSAYNLQEEALNKRKRIYDFLLKQGARGATADEVWVALGMGHSTTTSQINTLVYDGIIFPTCRTRLTRAGNCAYVYLPVSMLSAVDATLVGGPNRQRTVTRDHRKRPSEGESKAKWKARQVHGDVDDD